MIRFEGPIARQNQHVFATDWMGHVKENLADFKVPREVVFLDELPRNATGKILKKDLDKEE